MIVIETRNGPGPRERRAIRLDLRATDDEGSFEGYASVFGVKDDYGDVIVKGAFLASLSAHKAAGTMPALLWQHDPSEPIGIWAGMAEDERGLKVSGRLARDVARGREAHALLKMGALNGLSIGFVATEKSWNDKDGTRTLTGIDLWEVSLVTFPANGQARTTGVKSAAGLDQITKPSDAERWLRDAAPTLSKSDATAFVSRLMRMGEERREAAGRTVDLQRAADRLLASLQQKD